MAFSCKIRLRADWIAVILGLSATLPSMDDRPHRMVGGNRPVIPAVPNRGDL